MEKNCSTSPSTLRQKRGPGKGNSLVQSNTLIAKFEAQKSWSSTNSCFHASTCQTPSFSWHTDKGQRFRKAWQANFLPVRQETALPFGPQESFHVFFWWSVALKTHIFVKSGTVFVYTFGKNIHWARSKRSKNSLCHMDCLPVKLTHCLRDHSCVVAYAEDMPLHASAEALRGLRRHPYDKAFT